MKLNFKIKRETNLDSIIILNNIETYLKKHNYRIIENKEQVIKFVEDFGIDNQNTSSRSDYYTKVDDGAFKISINENDTKTLTFFLEFLSYLNL